ncbi:MULTISPECIES: hypothetical protein [Bacillus]|uniref:hypothetical protein n=1 Tax=Bacillus TaxID=1386 RepID=UPI002E2153B3|nr:hypothetical protein [Bacillus velezensis]
MTKTIQLQSVGHVPAVPASEIKEGDIRMYNFGSTATIVKVIEKTDKTLSIIEFYDDTNSYYISDIRKTTLVAIVDHKDISEHSPKVAKRVTGRNKGTVDVSEYFQPKENQQQKEPSDGKIEVKSISIIEHAGTNQYTNTTVKTFREAQKILISIYNSNDYEYIKTKFSVIWKDGSTHTGTMDITRKVLTENNSLNIHLNHYYRFVSGQGKPYSYSNEEYEGLLKAYGFTKSDIEQAKIFLSKYRFDDRQIK